MKLKVGDVVEFKKYEDMTGGEVMGISDDLFPKYGKITEIWNDGLFFIEDYGYLFNPKSVARVINEGDEVLIKVTIGEIRGNNILGSWVDKSGIVKVLKRKEPECFIVKEDRYGLYIGALRDLVSDKDRAKIYESRDDANEEAADMCLNGWDVIPYGD